MRRTLVVFTCLLAGCVVSQGGRVDPAFESAWLEDDVNRQAQTKDEYLGWVVSFYEGTAFVQGWTRRQADLCAGLEPAAAAAAQTRLEEFGRLVAAEWAKDNRRRRIDSDLLARMGGILADARSSGRLLKVLEILSADVRSVIAGDLDPKLLTSDRYDKLLAARIDS